MVNEWILVCFLVEFRSGLRSADFLSIAIFSHLNLFPLFLVVWAVDFFWSGVWLWPGCLVHFWIWK